MDTFKRYFVHFFLLVLAIAIILLIIVEPRISLKLYLLYFCIVLIVFVIPMSAFFSSIEATITIRIPCDDCEVVYSQVHAIIENKTNRILLSQKESESIYSIQPSKIEVCSKYKRWLTNDITVIQHASTIEVVTPRCYQKLFSEFVNINE